MIRTLSRYFLLAVSFAMLSCGDDDNDDASRTDLLTAHAWMVTQYEIDGQVSSPIKCSADNVVTFSRDGKYLSAVGAIKCDDNEEDGSGTWSLKDNDQVLSITADGVTDEATIVVLTSTTLKLKMTSVLTEDGEIIGEYDMYVIFSAK